MRESIPIYKDIFHAAEWFLESLFSTNNYVLFYFLSNIYIYMCVCVCVCVCVCEWVRQKT